MIDFASFTQKLEVWFAKNARPLPWRDCRDPYRIWVSEVMSHQTQIQRVAEHFYPRFIEKFPTILDLSKAEWKDVFPVWEGLGYYSRGKNMLKAAKTMVCKHKGIFPNNAEDLESLPGIGKYSSAAILSFAFGEKVPAIDTNISKIIQVLWPEENIIETAQVLVKLSDSSRAWNEGMMDLASRLRAGEKIEGGIAEFFTEEVAKKFIPVKAKPRKTPIKKTPKHKKRIEVGIACIWENGKYLVQSRPEGKSFTGFWEFPGGKREKGEDFRTCVKREIMEELGMTVSVRPHFYEELCEFNHVDLLLRFHRSQIQDGRPTPMEKQEVKWIDPKDFFTEKFLPTNHNALRVLQKMKV